MSTHETGGSECALLRAESAANRRDLDASANRITGVDRAIISRYFEDRWSPASVTRSARPPKMRRRWMIGGKLPATVRTDALPRQLESKLSRLDPGFERLLTGCDVLCIELANSRIVDVMHNAGAPATQDMPQLLIDDSADRAAGSADGL
jgi:hypothetical protein